MSALYQDNPYPKATRLHSKLDSSRSFNLTIGGFHTTIEYSYHGAKRSEARGIFVSAVTLMIKEGFDEIIDLHNGERFILISREFGFSIVATIHTDGADIIIDIISSIDSMEPTNPHNTLTIVV